MSKLEPLTPPDLSRCQAEKPWHGPFIVGGEIGNRSRGYRVRCRNTPTVIAKENKPGEDGRHGSMSLCSECRDAMVKQCGEDYATFTNLGKLDD